MKSVASVMFIVVPVLNILLNALTHRAAKESNSVPDALWSGTFLLTVAVGTLSVTSLIILYRSGVELPRGMLFMGAASILGGTMWGVFYTGVKFTPLEWGLYACIAAFMAARFFQIFTS